MNPELVPLLSFVVITTFTPGPNNIASASMGLSYGYKKTLPFLLGIFTGFVLIMVVCAYASTNLISRIPNIERIMSLIGALYITWLAYHTLRANYNFSEEKQKPLRYTNGFLLQILNPKVIIYGLTLYSTFLRELPRHSLLLPLSALGFAAVSLASISTWTLFGNFIRRFMKRNFIKQGVNISLSLLLIATAVKISGII